MDKLMDAQKRRKMLSSDITLEDYKRHLADWSKHNLKNIHFTGGEATLHPDLPEFVMLATEQGILSTLTTNGTARPEVYERLVRNGLSEIRLSIDTTVNEEFDRIVGVKGAGKKVKTTIGSLTDLRDDGEDIYIVLNACVGSFNIDGIKDTLGALMDLRPDAIKFLVVAEQKDDVHVEASRGFVDELLDYVRSTGRDDELLNAKIRSMFRSSTSGLSCNSSRFEMENCFIPLTERTLDSSSLYPCSIYLRYKGKPLISADASFAEQQEAILRFVKEYDCRLDEICKANCTSCCKNYNIQVNRLMHDGAAKAKAHESAPISVNRITNTEVSDFIRRQNEILQSETEDTAPFMIIKPQGMDHKDDILSYLAEQGIVVREKQVIDNWQDLSLFLYARSGRDPEFRVASNIAYMHIDPSDAAVCLELEENIPEAKLNRIKTQLRNWYGQKYRKFSYEGKEVMLRSNCVHVPDYKDLSRERKVLEYFLRKA